MKKSIILFLLFTITIKINSQCEHKLRFSHKYNIDIPIGFILERFIDKNTIFFDFSLNGMLRRNINDKYVYSTIDSDGYVNLSKLYPNILINGGFGINISDRDGLNVRLNLGLGYGTINTITYRLNTQRLNGSSEIYNGYLNYNTTLIFDLKDKFIIGIAYDRGLYNYNGFPSIIFGVPFKCLYKPKEIKEEDDYEERINNMLKKYE